MRATGNSMRSAKRLRRSMSPPEALLWQFLRRSPAGIKFRRQYAIGPYVADFYCPSAKLIVEIDGQIHNFERQADHDVRRNELIASYGVRVERIAAADVLRDARAVASAIVETCLAGPLHHSAAPSGPPPHRPRRQGGSDEAPPSDRSSLFSRSGNGEGDHGAKRHGGGAK